MRFLIRIIVIAVLIALVLRVIRAALEKLSGNVEVIPPERRQKRHSGQVIVDQEDEAEASRRTGRR
jgi:hypothetical protein